METKKIWLAATVASWALSGCASRMGHSVSEVVLTSVPAQAHYVVTNRQGETVAQGLTPAVAILPNGGDYFQAERYRIRFSKPGYQDITEQLCGELNLWYLGNFPFDPIGLLVFDPLTGSMYRLPGALHVDLPKRRLDAAGAGNGYSEEDF